MPSLGLLLVFRTNTAYARWDEARKNWGLNINHTRDLTRMATAYYDAANPTVTPTRRSYDLQRIAVGAWTFARAMERHLSPTQDDEDNFRRDVTARLSTSQAEALLKSQHRPNRALQDLSTVIESLPNIHFMRKDKLHASLTRFEDNLGSSERLLSSPVPLFYTRHTTRFLAVWISLLPLALYEVFQGHVSMIPATMVLSTCLFGIDELATQLEEPFTILPMHTFCDKIYDSCMEIVKFTSSSSSSQRQNHQSSHPRDSEFDVLNESQPQQHLPHNNSHQSGGLFMAP
jgi:predicted membrane chloride channel (bestrophin family)